jgi:hypothetical protein
MNKGRATYIAALKSAASHDLSPLLAFAGLEANSDG